MSGPSSISGGSYTPLDPQDFETQDVEGAGARAPLGDDEKRWRREVVRSVTAKPMAGIRATLALIAGKETEGTRARRTPMFRITARDGGSDVHLHVELARDMGSSPPKVLTTFDLWEDGGAAGHMDLFVALSPDGTLRSRDKPGDQLLMLPDRERDLAIARQQLDGRPGLSVAERTTIAEALDTVRARVAERLNRP